jgi:hypothetical protein
MIRGFTRLLAVVVTTAGLAALLSHSASAADPYHVRGKLAEVDGGALAIDTDMDGRKAVTLAEEAGVFIVDTAALEDIKEGQFVGITSIMSGGQRVALEVHIFSEDLRGLAEGHYPWSLVEEENMMTNANVAKLVAVGDDRQLTVNYMEGEEGAQTEGMQTIVVPPGAAIVNFTTTTRDKLLPGETVFLLAVDGEDGSVSSPAIVVGQNGVEPPM